MTEFNTSVGSSKLPVNMATKRIAFRIPSKKFGVEKIQTGYPAADTLTN
jgi:hypothetical protein